jgi:hypothetical protein
LFSGQKSICNESFTTQHFKNLFYAFLAGMDSGMMQQQGINIQQQQQQMVGGNLPMSMSATGSLTMAGGTMTMANGNSF